MSPLGTKHPEMRVRAVGALLLALLAFVSCGAEGDAALSEAPTARYTVKVDANVDGKSRMVLEGLVNFAENFERYGQYYDGGLPFGHDRGVLVWDFTDFGLAVDMFLPPAEKVT